MVDKSLHLAAMDYERRWGCAPCHPEPENKIYLWWEMPKTKPSCWVNCSDN